MQFDTDIVITYLIRVVQNWFEVGLNNQGIVQDWLSNWNLFLDELHWHFGLSNSIGKAANILDNNLYMKSGDNISTYNMDFICYTSQLGWKNSVLYYYYY